MGAAVGNTKLGGAALGANKFNDFARGGQKYVVAGATFWAELVRSRATNPPLVEDASGDRVWLRTSDGEPMEQQELRGSRWVDISGDTTEPDFVGLIYGGIFRFRRPGLAWLPSNNGINFANINWNRAATYRFFEGTYQ